MPKNKYWYKSTFKSGDRKSVDDKSSKTSPQTLTSPQNLDNAGSKEMPSAPIEASFEPLQGFDEFVKDKPLPHHTFSKCDIRDLEDKSQHRSSMKRDESVQRFNVSPLGFDSDLKAVSGIDSDSSDNEFELKISSWKSYKPHWKTTKRGIVRRRSPPADYKKSVDDFKSESACNTAILKPTSEIKVNKETGKYGRKIVGRGIYKCSATSPETNVKEENKTMVAECNLQSLTIDNKANLLLNEVFHRSDMATKVMENFMINEIPETYSSVAANRDWFKPMAPGFSYHLDAPSTPDDLTNDEFVTYIYNKFRKPSVLPSNNEFGYSSFQCGTEASEENAKEKDDNNKPKDKSE